MESMLRALFLALAFLSGQVSGAGQVASRFRGQSGSGVGGSSSLRVRSTAATSGTQGSEDAVSACSCDCCIAQPIAAGSLVCVPRAGDVATPAGTGGCAVTCRVPDEEARAHFDAVSGEVDYARYCPSSCASFKAGQEPAFSGEALLCAASAAVAAAMAARDAQGAAALAQGRVAAPMLLPPGAPQAFQLLSRSAATALVAGPAPAPAAASLAEKVTDAVLNLAKSEMEEARRHAEAAGAGAKAAREAYEATLATSSAMGTAAGKAMFKQVRRSAREQASEVLRDRRKYEDSARLNAMKASQDAAMVYRKAKQRDTSLANTWGERAIQFKEASRERETRAEDDALQAQSYMDNHDLEAANGYKAKAQDEMEQADMFGKQARAAEEQGNAIAEGASWYDEAMQAAARFALVDAMPPDVPPPPPPALR